MDPLRLVRGQAERLGGQGRHSARDPHQGAHAAQVHRLLRHVQLLIDPRHDARLVLRRNTAGRIDARQELLRDPDGAHVDRYRLLDARVPQDQLGGAAPDVDDQHGRIDAPPEPGHRAREGQRRLLGPGDHLRVHPDDAPDLARELVAVGGVPRGRRGDEAHTRGAQGLDHPLVLDGGLDGALDRRALEHARAVHPASEAHDPHLAGQIRQAGSPLVPDDVGHEQSY